MPRISRVTLLRALALLLVIALSLAIFFLPDEQIEQLKALGYPGLFILAALSYATVFLPTPAGLVVFAMGAHLPPLGVAIAAGSGAAIGELTGYLAGFSGQAAVERTVAYQRLVGWMQRNGGLTIYLLATIPNPLVDLSGIAAGALRVPVYKFLFFCWLGQMTKMFAIASLGAGLA
jgi:membrane protein YqaA with SNARE-associated domain